MAFKVYINNWDDMDAFNLAFSKTESFKRPRTYFCKIGGKSKQFCSVEGCYNFWCNNSHKSMLILIDGYIPKKTLKDWYAYVKTKKNKRRY